MTNKDLLEDRFGDCEVIHKYFSSYHEGLLPLSPEVWKQIDQVIERQKLGQEIAKAWKPNLENTHLSIPNEECLKTALTAQFTFDRALSNLKKIDQYQRLIHGKVKSELNLLKRSTGPWVYVTKFSESETKFLGQIREKAKTFGRTFAEQVNRSIEMREALIVKLQMKVSEIKIPLLNDNLPQQLTVIEERVSGDIKEIHKSIRECVVSVQGDPILEPAKAVFRIDDEAESVESALNSHENRDVREKTRRKDGERVNRPESGAIRQKLKLWTDNSKDTASVDCHEAILVNRAMIERILEGKLDQIPQKVCQNLGEYFDALLTNDLAKLKGSYLSYHPFAQARKIQSFIHENLKTNHYAANTITPYLESGNKVAYSWEKDRARLALLTQDIFESYTSWRNALGQFLDDTGKILSDELHEQFRLFMFSLNDFVDQTPHPVISDVLRQRKAIFRKYDEIQAELIRNRDEIAKHYDKQPVVREQKVALIEKAQVEQNKAKALELDQIWPEWRKGKTADEIDAILSETILRMKDSLKTLTQSLVQINVPFSSPHRQRKFEELLNPALLEQYRKAIPPIWQNKVKIQLVIQGELMRGTELSPLWLEMAETMEIADQELIKNEFIRSRLSKLMV